MRAAVFHAADDSCPYEHLFFSISCLSCNLVYVVKLPERKEATERVALIKFYNTHHCLVPENELGTVQILWCGDT